MREIIFLSSTFKERIWGGEYFYNLGKSNCKEAIGEMWSVSAHPEGESVVLNGKFRGQTLSEVYYKNKDFFNNPTSKVFPILIKLIATSADLSVQVHPDDDYALKHENELGKTEGWLILDAEEDARIVLGHHARSKQELVDLIEKNQYEKLLNYITVRKGEFYPIPAGTIHALGKGLIILEIQQSSNITYRVYDYDRYDKDGKTRELHKDKAIEVAKVGNIVSENLINFLDNDYDEIELWNNEYFRVNIARVIDNYHFPSFEYYAVITVIEGKLEVCGKILTIGDSFIIPHSTKDLSIYGQGRIVITTPNEE